jgi:hypothetical protein
MNMGQSVAKLFWRPDLTGRKAEIAQPLENPVAGGRERCNN